MTSDVNFESMSHMGSLIAPSLFFIANQLIQNWDQVAVAWQLSQIRRY